MNLTLTITRAALSLPDLVITNDPNGADFWLPEDGLEEPEQTWRLGYMPDHPDIHGREPLSAVRENSAIPGTVYTQAASAAALKANKATLANALGQFSYDATLDVDGEAYTYSAYACGPRWGAVDSGMVRARLAKASFVIPVYPIAS